MASTFQLRPSMCSVRTLSPAAVPRRLAHLLPRRRGAASFRCSAAPSRRGYSVTLIPGDGIGPEVVSVARDVLSLVGSHEGEALPLKQTVHSLLVPSSRSPFSSPLWFLLFFPFLPKTVLFPTDEKLIQGSSSDSKRCQWAARLWTRSEFRSRRRPSPLQRTRTQSFSAPLEGQCGFPVWLLSCAACSRIKDKARVSPPRLASERPAQSQTCCRPSRMYPISGFPCGLDFVFFLIILLWFRRKHGGISRYKWDSNEKSLKPETGLLQLRAGLGVFANLRPASVFPQVISISNAITLLFSRKCSLMHILNWVRINGHLVWIVYCLWSPQ